MGKEETAGVAVDDTYIEEAVTQSLRAYRNLCLLAMKKRADLGAICSAVNRSMRKFMTSNKILLQVEFDGIAYISSIAGELGKSLISILYMGEKEQDETLWRILKSITAADIIKFKEVENSPTLAVEFEVMLHVTGAEQEVVSESGYLLTFRKHRNPGGTEYWYTMHTEYKIDPDSPVNVPPFMTDRVLIRKESNGILADFVERIILLNPSIGDHNTDSLQAGSEQTPGTLTSFDAMYTNLKKALAGEKVSDPESGVTKTGNTETDKKMQDRTLRKKESVNKGGEQNEGTKSTPAKKVFTIMKCKSSIGKYKTPGRQFKHVVTVDENGKEQSIPVIVDYKEMRIFIADGMYLQYGAYLKKSMRIV